MPRDPELRALALAALLVAALAGAGTAKAQQSDTAAPHREPAGEVAKWWDSVFRRLPQGEADEARSFAAYCVERSLGEGLLKEGSKALVLAMGDGRNAILLARHGLEVTGLDVSPVAIDKARKAAEAAGVKLATIEADLFTHDLGDGQWDLVTNIYFNPAIQALDRIKKAVRPGGLLLIEGFGSDYTGGGPPPWSRYRPNQLLEALAGWRILEYEDGRFASDWAGGDRVPVIRLLARKPAD